MRRVRQKVLSQRFGQGDISGSVRIGCFGRGHRCRAAKVVRMLENLVQLSSEALDLRIIELKMGEGGNALDLFPIDTHGQSFSSEA